MSTRVKMLEFPMGYFSLFGKSHFAVRKKSNRKPLIRIIFVFTVIITTSVIILSPSGKKVIPKHWQIIRPPHEVSALAEGDDFIWAGGRDGVYKIEKDTGSLALELKCDIALSYVRALQFDLSGGLWIAHSSGLSYYDGTACKTYRETDGLPDKRVNALYLDHSGRLWVGTVAGAAVYEDKRFNKFLPVGGLADEMVNVIMEDSGGGMWFGSYNVRHGGLSYCNNGRCQHFTVKEGLPNNNITSIKETPDGKVWVGTGFYNSGGAVWFIKRQEGWFLSGTLLKNDGLAGEKVRSIYLDKRGAMWYGSEYDGIAVRNNGCWNVITVDDGLSDNEAKIMIEDKNGNLWIGTRNGITRISPKELEDVSFQALQLR